MRDDRQSCNEWALFSVNQYWTLFWIDIDKKDLIQVILNLLDTETSVNVKNNVHNLTYGYSAQDFCCLCLKKTSILAASELDQTVTYEYIVYTTVRLFDYRLLRIIY